MKRRTLLATIGTGTLLGGAGCYGINALTNDDGSDGDQEAGGDEPANNGSAENGSDSSQSDGNNTEGDGSEENTTDQESNESDGENNESEDGDPEGNETEEDGESNESDGSSRPSDPTETITLTDHGVDIEDSPEQDIDKEVYCYGKFKNGSHPLRKVRVDAVALAKDGTRLDHAWKPFARLDPGETFEVRFRFFVDPAEMHEYLVGATEAQYVES